MKCYLPLLHTEKEPISALTMKEHYSFMPNPVFFPQHRGVRLIPDSPDIFLNSAAAPPVNSSFVAISPTRRAYREGIGHVQRLPAEKHNFKGAQNLMSTYEGRSKRNRFAFNDVTKMKGSI